MSSHLPSRCMGFTLIELVVVLAIMAIGSALVVINWQSNPQQSLNQESDHLALVLDTARSLARTTGTPLIWRASAAGFSVQAVNDKTATPPFTAWLNPPIYAEPNQLVLSPEAISSPIFIRLQSGSANQSLTLVSDGVLPFHA